MNERSLRTTRWSFRYGRLVFFGGVLLLLLCCILEDERGTGAKGGVNADEIPVKSQNDKRNYRYITLSTNKLGILLISDPNTTSSSASVSVPAGSYSDDDDIPGLAHFLEHMLFLGTEKYPVESEFDTFLSSHGGWSNAWTDDEETNFYFVVDSGYYQPALDRFAQFFISPAFNPDSTAREINAVNAEFEKDRNDDDWRFDQLLRSTANPVHPYHKFGTGSTSTLKTIPDEEGIDVRQRLLDFHSRYYSANILKVALLGKEDLDELEDWAKEIFGAVPNRDREVPTFFNAGPVFLPSQLQIQLNVVPIDDMQLLQLFFPLGPLMNDYKTLPLNLVDFVLNYEGKGSLTSYLQRKGLAEYVYAYTWSSTREFSIYAIEIELTKNGLKNYNEIVTHIFECLKLISSSSKQDKLRILKELNQTSYTNFRFASAQEVSSIDETGSRLQYYPVTDCLTAENIYLADFDLDDLQSQVLDLLTPENMRLHLVSKSYEGHTNLTEPWYGTEYNSLPIPSNLITGWKSVSLNKELTLPHPNPFIPTNFDIKKPAQETTYPVLLSTGDSDLLQAYYKHDTVFNVPKADLNIQFISPLGYSTPTTALYTELFVGILEYELADIIMDADIAGLSCGIYDTIEGMEIEFSGFNEKLGVLVEDVLNVIVNFSSPNSPLFSRSSFDLKLEEMKDSYSSMKYVSASTLASSRRASTTRTPYWSNEEYDLYLSSLNFEEFKRFTPELLGHAFVQLLGHGNLLPQEVTSIASTVKSVLNYQRLPSVLWPSPRTLKLQRGNSYLRAVKPHSKEKNSAINYYIQFTPASSFNYVMSSLLEVVLSEMCFDRLRTVEQLGYLVSCGRATEGSVVGFEFDIQSGRDPQYLHSRIEVFLNETAKNAILEMTQTQFEEYTESLRLELLRPPTDLNEQTGLYWDEITGLTYDFDFFSEALTILDSLKLEDLQSFFSYFLLRNETASKLSIHVYGSMYFNMINDLDAYANFTIINNLGLFQRSLPLFSDFTESSDDEWRRKDNNNKEDGAKEDISVFWVIGFLVMTIVTLGETAFIARLYYQKRKRNQVDFTTVANQLELENAFTSTLDDDDDEDLNAVL